MLQYLFRHGEGTENPRGDAFAVPRLPDEYLFLFKICIGTEVPEKFFPVSFMKGLMAVG